MKDISPLLIVDDEPDYLDEVLEALAYEGLTALSAANGLIAVDILRRHPEIHVVVTDIRMPEMDGIALIRAARAEFDDRDIRFIVVTGHGSKADIERAKAVGVMDCLSKPVAVDTLHRVIKSLPS
ncbi:response regulator [Xanthobacteraceae bacterium A53D]